MLVKKLTMMVIAFVACSSSSCNEEDYQTLSVGEVTKREEGTCCKLLKNDIYITTVRCPSNSQVGDTIMFGCPTDWHKLN